MNARDRAGRRTPTRSGPKGALAPSPPPVPIRSEPPRTHGPRAAASRPVATRERERLASRSHHPVTRGPRRQPRPVRHRKGPPATFDRQRLAKRAKARIRAKHLWSAGTPRRRLIALLVVTVLGFCGVLVRVGLLQIAESGDYQAYANQQRVRSEVLKAPRGTILDRDGNDLAMSVVSSTVFADPKAVVDPAATAAALAQLLGLDEKRQHTLEAAFEAKTSDFVYVARQIDPALAKTVSDLDLPGIGVQEEPSRYLPNGLVARGLVGRTDIDGKGIGGIELQYDALLTGQDGQLRREFGTKGRSMPSGDKALVDAVAGDDVQLTIDMSLQYRVEQYLVDAVNAFESKGATAIVMDTQTGEILAMASARRDAPDKGAQVATGNYAAVDAYEPGSVVKVITVAAGLNEGVVTPDSTFLVPSEKKFYDLVLHDAEPHPPTTYTVHQILAKSSNIGTIFVSQQMGTAKQEAYMRAFGLGEATALDFPGESRGILKPYQQWFGTENVTMAYGQGVAATAVQLVSAVNVLANDGVYVAPKLVKSVITPDGVVEATQPSATRRVVSSGVAEEMNVMMRDVVCTGTARGQIDLTGYTVAGKTGTGYKAQPNGGYLDAEGNHSYYASFVGFLPAEAPRITILVSIDEPPADADHFGATTAAPIFGEIAQTAIVELGIQAPNDRGGCPVKTKSGG